MRTTILASFIALLALGSGTAAQQTAEPTPDFAGTWKLKSIDGPTDMMSTSKQKAVLTMEITQDAILLKVREWGTWDGKSTNEESAYYLDGRGENNMTESGQHSIKTTTIFKKSKLIIKGSYFEVPSNKAVGDFKDEWALSKDGQKISRTHTQNLPAGPGSFEVIDKYTYVRIK